jgi:hypothetical protein
MSDLSVKLLAHAAAICRRLLKQNFINFLIKDQLTLPSDKLLTLCDRLWIKASKFAEK